MILQIIPPADSVDVGTKVTEVIETIRNTPSEILMGDLIDKLVSFGVKVIAAILLYFVGAWIIRKIKKAVAAIFLKKNTDVAIASFVQSILSILLTGVLLLIVVATLGIDTSSFAALLTGGGLAVGMALNGTLQNFAGGMMILIFKPFKAGDYIEAQGYSGTVSEVTITSTKLLTVDNRVIIIPNGILSNDVINNYSSRQIRRLDLSINVEYGASSEETKALLRSLIEADSRVLTLETGAPADPFVALSALNDSSVEFIVRVWVATDNYWALKFDITEKIYCELPKHDIKFPFPQLDVNLKQN